MNLYKIKLTYLNIESGGATEYDHTYNLWAPNYGTAIERAIKKLGSNVDGGVLAVEGHMLRLEAAERCEDRIDG